MCEKPHQINKQTKKKPKKNQKDNIKKHKTKQNKLMWKNYDIVKVTNIRKFFTHTENWNKKSVILSRENKNTQNSKKQRKDASRITIHRIPWLISSLYRLHTSSFARQFLVLIYVHLLLSYFLWIYTMFSHCSVLQSL